MKSLCGTIGELHRQLEKEVRPIFWSTRMESELGTYLWGKPELVARFSIPVIQCRSSTCKVQAMGYGSEAAEVWEAATSDVEAQPWFYFDNEERVIDSRDGITAVLWVLEEE